jgi:WD40 repeat protein
MALKHDNEVWCVAWSPNGQILASGGGRGGTVRLWDATTGKPLRRMEECKDNIINLAWSPDGKKLMGVGCHIAIWDVEIGRIFYYSIDIHGLDAAWSPDGSKICTLSDDNEIAIWNAVTGNIICESKHKKGYGHLFLGAGWSLNLSHPSIAWSPDNQIIASVSPDYSIRIWTITGRLIRVLEAHTSSIKSISFLDDGRLLASHEKDGALIIWRTDIWTEVAHINEIETTSYTSSNLASHRVLPIMAIIGEMGRKINILVLNYAALRSAEPFSSTMHYINAKAVLLGESGVGKSGLGIRIAEGIFRPTESTHGAQFWHLPVEQVPNLPSNLHAELTLWDLAG